MACKAEALCQRLHEVRKRLVRGHIDGVSLERGRLKITPYDAVYAVRRQTP